VGIQGYIVHVKTAHEREKHMLSQIGNLPFKFKFILAGDQEDLTAEIKNSYFTQSMQECYSKGAISCTYKHILALEDMIKNNISYGIIFENDIFLSGNFTNAVNKAIAEVKERNIKNFYLSLEDSLLVFVKGSERVKGRTVYKIERGKYNVKNGYNTRCAGAYIVDLEAAKSVVEEVKKNKCAQVSDWFWTHLVSSNIVDLYYLHPTVASQGSHNGRLGSLFAGVNRRGRLSYYIQKAYKRLLWRLR